MSITGEFILQQLIISNTLFETKFMNNDKQARHSVYVHEFDFIFQLFYVHF